MSWLKHKITRPNRGSPRQLLALQSQLIGAQLQSRRLKVKGREVLLRNMPERGVGAEIGVWRGDFSRVLLDRLEPSELWLVDPWPDPHAADKSYPMDGAGRMIGADGEDLVTAEDADRMCERVRRIFAGDERVRVLRQTSEQAAAEAPDRHFDWVYLDGMHFYEDVKRDLLLWSRKLKPGGVICGDDYYWRDHDGALSVKKAVDEWVAATRPSRWFAFRGQYLIRPRAY